MEYWNIDGGILEYWLCSETTESIIVQHCLPPSNWLLSGGDASVTRVIKIATRFILSNKLRELCQQCEFEFVMVYSVTTAWGTLLTEDTMPEVMGPEGTILKLRLRPRPDCPYNHL